MSAMESAEMNNSVVVAQLCGRRHYAVPVVFERAGILRHFYTDLWAGKGIVGRTVRGLAPRVHLGLLKKWAGRYEPRLPGDKVTAFTRLGLEYSLRLRAARTRSELTRTYLWAGERFGRLVAQRGFHGASTVYGVHGGAREIFRAAKGRRLRTVLDQTSCPQLWCRLEKEERRRWPAWVMDGSDDGYAESAADWENAELSLSDVVICPSDFVRRYVVSLGVPQEKTRMVPYGLTVGRFAWGREPYHGDRPLRVLFIGKVSLMKGVPYLFEALRLLNSNSVEARFVGPIGISEKALFPYRRYCQIVGPVPRSEILRHYAWADVFVLPSLCEGSALVTYEALAAGLPVICTPNTGSVVRHGSDGFIVPVRDAGALARKVGCLAHDHGLLSEMSQQAREQAQSFSLQKYGSRLIRAVLGPSNG
ncbi:MAG: glycosyltransferase family 4 protein [bacterium]|nr:glycosyltransferase family 4 protein [bacterium]